MDVGVLTLVWVYSYPSGFASTRKYQSILSTYWRTVPLIQYLVSNCNKDVLKIRQIPTGMSAKGTYHPKMKGQVAQFIHFFREKLSMNSLNLMTKNCSQKDLIQGSLKLKASVLTIIPRSQV